MKTIASDLTLALTVGSHVERSYYVEPGAATMTVDGREYDSLPDALDAALDRRAHDPIYARLVAGSDTLTLGDTTPVRIDHRLLIRHPGNGATDVSILRYEYSQDEALEALPRLLGFVR